MYTYWIPTIKTRLHKIIQKTHAFRYNKTRKILFCLINNYPCTWAVGWFLFFFISLHHKQTVITVNDVHVSAETRSPSLHASECGDKHARARETITCGCVTNKIRTDSMKIAADTHIAKRTLWHFASETAGLSVTTCADPAVCHGWKRFDIFDRPRGRRNVTIEPFSRFSGVFVIVVQ